MQIHTPDRGDNAVLYTGREKIEAQDLTNEARNCAVLDSGFHRLQQRDYEWTVIQNLFLRTVLQKLLKRRVSGHLNDKVEISIETVTCPCTIVGKQVQIKSDIANTGIPLLEQKQP